MFRPPHGVPRAMVDEVTNTAVWIAASAAPVLTPAMPSDEDVERARKRAGTSTA